MIKKSFLTLLTTAMIASPFANAAQAGDYYVDDYQVSSEWDNGIYYDDNRREKRNQISQQRRGAENWIRGDRELRKGSRAERRAEKRREKRRLERLEQERLAEQQRKRDKKKDRNTAIALGVFGLIAGAAIIGSINNNQNQNRRVQPNRRYEAPTNNNNPKVVYSTRLQPWSEAWFAHCSAKYRSFNPNNGTYLGYDGKHHMCK